MVRTQLSRDTIVSTAIGQADQDGLDQLSMRKLGEALGVEAMSLYHHVPNKSALTDAMVDRVLEEIGVPDDPAWRTGLRRRARSQRAALTRHRWALSLLASRGAPGRTALLHQDAVLGYLRAAGFSLWAAGLSHSVLDAFVVGFVLQEPEADSAATRAHQMLAPSPGPELPNLVEFTREVVLSGSYDVADEFEVGLDLVVDAVARLLG